MNSKKKVFWQKHFRNESNTTPSLHTQYQDEILLIDAYRQVLNLQILLIHELIKNKRLITLYNKEFQVEPFKAKIKSVNTAREKMYQSEPVKSVYASQNPLSLKNSNSSSSEFILTKKCPKIKKKAKKSSSYFYPQSQISKKNDKKSFRQTKHIPKNYGKAIINFITKNVNIVSVVCKKYEKDFDQFLKIVKSYKGKILTMVNLKSLWIDEENKYAKIFRILSMLYLRKHCLQHIFNSRIENQNRHIKYRYKIIQAVADPEAFHRIKQY